MYNINSQNVSGLAMAFSDAGIGLGTTQGATGTVKTTATLSFTIDSQWYSKAATDNIAVNPIAKPGGGSWDIQPVLTTCLYLLQIDSAGVVSSVPGKPVLSADLTAGSAILEYPMPSKDRAVFGAYRVTVASTATYYLGVTALNATNVTTTYLDLIGLPTNGVTV